MQFHKLFFVCFCTSVILSSGGCRNENKQEPAQRTADNVLQGIRLKQLARDLQLNDEQKNQVKVLLDEEERELAKIHEDAVSPAQAADKIGELRKVTYGKMKPLLTPPQLEKLEQALAKSEKRKKRT